MTALLQGLAPQVQLFMLIATRLSALVLTAPVLNSRVIPTRVKAGLVILVSYVSLPLVAADAATPPTALLPFVLLALKEALVGITFGLIAQFVFAGIQTAGALMDIGAGFAIAQSIDPTTNNSATILGRWYNLVAVAAFLAVGGHQWMMAGVVRSFELAPPMSGIEAGALVSGVLGRADEILLIAVQIGAPVIAALVVTDVTLGIISRSVPQMNVFLVGLPLKIVVALAATAILTPALVGFTNGLFDQMLIDLSAIVRAAGG